MKQRKPIFKQGVSLLTICIFLGLVYAEKGDKERSAFQKVSGTVLSIDNTNEHHPGLDTSRFRYVQIDNFSQPFQIFIGKNSGDFKPKLEQIDRLKVGDSLTVYCEESSKTRNDAVNNLAYFIDRDLKLFLLKGIQLPA